VSAIYAEHPLIAKGTRRLVRERLGAHCDRLIFLNSGRIRWLERLRSLFSLFGVDVGDVLDLWERNPCLGVPMDRTMRSLYWRKRFKPPSTYDPDRDRCGLYWNCVVAPLAGDSLLRATAIINRVVLGHGLEPKHCLYGVVGLWPLRPDLRHVHL